MAKIQSVFNQEVKKETHPRRMTKWIHYTKLISNKKQYSHPKDKEELEALADLIEASGEVLQDLLVYKSDTDEYVIIGGHKRHAACKILVEEREKEQFAFLPCFVRNLSDVRAEFEVYSSNGRHEETHYEKMHKIERMQWLLTNYPEEFPGLQSGPMIERLAKQLNMKKTTVGEYQTIAKNLGERGREAFQEGKIEKSAAVTLSKMPEEEQEKALEKGITTDVALKQYTKEMLEPTEQEIIDSYNALDLKEDYDQEDRKKVVRKLISDMGKSHTNLWLEYIRIQCSPKYIVINGKKITWIRYGHLLDTYIPFQEEADSGRIPNFGTHMQEKEENVLDAQSDEAGKRVSMKVTISFSLYDLDVSEACEKAYEQAQRALQRMKAEDFIPCIESIEYIDRRIEEDYGKEAGQPKQENNL